MMQEWLESQWNKPSRSDYYLMRVAQRVQQVLAKNPGGIDLDNQKIEWIPKQAKGKVSQADLEAHKRQRIRQIGGDVKTLTLTPEEMAEIDRLPPEEAARRRRQLAGA